MARPMKPLVRSGGYYPSNGWTPLVYPGGYTTANGGEEPAPPPIEKTVTGNPIHILDALAKPVQSLSVKLEPIQSLNGYDNPWPAGGGKNLLPPHAVGSLETSGVVFTFNVDETITITGTPTENYTYCGIYGANSTNASILKPLLNGLAAGGNLSMTIDGNPTGIDLVCQFNRADGTLTTTRYTSSMDATAVPSDAVYMYVAIRVLKNYVTAPINATVKVFVGNSASTENWTPYSNICPISGWTGANIHVSPTTDAEDGTTYSITFPSSAGTVYGGTLDVTTGKLTVDRAFAEFDGSEDENWSRYAGGSAGAYAMQIVVNGLKFVRGDAIYVISNYLKSLSGDDTWGNYDAFISANCVSGIKTGVRSITTVNAWREYLADAPLQIVYYLTTPIVYDLTPTEVTLLLGENNLFSDGEMTLVYLADGNASEIEALNILLGGQYVNNHGEDEPSDREALDIVLGGKR